MAARFPMTLEGEQALRVELNHLKTEERPRIIQAIADARADGDLKENADYQAAREQQSFCEGRIAELESKLGSAEVINIKDITYSGRVVFGATITLINCDTDEKVSYQIVGADEADLKQLKLSYSSPLAKAMIGKSVDDIFQVKTPGGLMEYEVAKVEHL